VHGVGAGAHADRWDVALSAPPPGGLSGRREEEQKRRKEEAAAKKKKEKASKLSRLSFADDDDGEEEEEAGKHKHESSPQTRTNPGSRYGAVAEVVVVKKKALKNPGVETSFLPDPEAERQQKEMREKLAEEWRLEQERIKGA
jgi:protein FAM50